MVCSDFGIGALKVVEVAQTSMLRSHCYPVVAPGSEKEATAAMVDSVDEFAVAATLEAAEATQPRSVIVEPTAAAAVAAIFGEVVIAVALRGPAVTVAESAAAAVSSGTGFAAVVSVAAASA